MAQEFKEVPLGEVGTAYVREALKGGGTFSRKVLELAVIGGTSYAPRPSDMDPAQALCFDQGRGDSQRLIWDWLASHIPSLFGKSKEWTFAVADAWMKPSDVLHPAPNAYYCGSTILFAVPGQDFTARKMQAAIQSVISFEFHAFVSGIALHPDQIGANHMLDPAELHGFVRNIREVMVSAYDQEGVVVWTP